MLKCKHVGMIIFMIMINFMLSLVKFIILGPDDNPLNYTFERCGYDQGLHSFLTKCSKDI